MSTPIAIILAAGKGTRMTSDLPKVLHRIGGEPLVAYPIRTARAAGADTVVLVVGYQAERVQQEVSARFPDGVQDGWLRFALQAEQRGTGHAVMCALPQLLAEQGVALILSGDVPLLRPSTLEALAAAAQRSTAGLAMTSFRPEDRTGYGRVVRDARGRVQGIVEERDADPVTFAIEECNAGTYAVELRHLRSDLPRLSQDNAQGEIYLTDLVALAAERGEVAAIEIDVIEAAGINTTEQLAALEAMIGRR